MSFRLDLDDDVLHVLAERLVERVQLLAQGSSSPWMDFQTLCRYTQIPEGTLRKLTASGVIPAHGGRTKIYHREEVDQALLAYRSPSQGALRIAG